MKNRICFSCRKIDYIIKNCCLKSKNTFAIQIICKEELNVMSRDYNLKSIYKESNYNRNNN